MSKQDVLDKIDAVWLPIEYRRGWRVELWQVGRHIRSALGPTYQRAAYYRRQGAAQARADQLNREAGNG